MNGHAAAGDFPVETWSAVLTAYGPLTADGTTIIASPNGWWKLLMTGSGTGAAIFNAPVTKTAAYTVVGRDFVLVDLATAAANLTMTLDTLFPDEACCVVKIKGASLGYSCTVDAGTGRTIDGIAQTLVLELDGETLTLKKSGSTFWEF